MLKGKRVSIEDPSKLKPFYPSHRIIKDVPLLGGKYIYVGEDSFDLTQFYTSIWITGKVHRTEIRLNTIESIIEFVEFFKKVPKRVKEYLFSEQSVDEAWKILSFFYIFGVSLVGEEEAQVFQLFCQLNKTNKEIYEVYSKIELPLRVVISSLLTMISKSQSYRDYMGVVSSGYMKQLTIMNKTLRNVKRKFIRFWLSDQSELQFLNLLFELRK